jgi:threonine synthase
LVKARQRSLIGPDEEVVLQLTGSGFKDLRAALRAAGQPIPIRSLADVHP